VWADKRSRPAATPQIFLFFPAFREFRVSARNRQPAKQHENPDGGCGRANSTISSTLPEFGLTRDQGLEHAGPGLVLYVIERTRRHVEIVPKIFLG